MTKREIILLIPIIGFIYLIYLGFTVGAFTPICRSIVGFCSGLIQATCIGYILIYSLI